MRLKLVLLVTLITGIGWSCLATNIGRLDEKTDSIQITARTRNYITGPIDGQMLMSKYDVIELYAGPLPPQDQLPFKRHIRKWVMWGDEDNPESLCYLQRSYDYGMTVLFQCPIGGSIIAYVSDFTEDELILKQTFMKAVGAADQSETICDYRACIKFFDLTDRFRGTNDEFYKEFKAKKEAIIRHTQSDPINILPDSDFCYYWNYRIEQKARVGYVFRESEPRTGGAVEGSYLMMELIIWIIEPNSITESELDPSVNNLVISDYSKLLTRRFHAKGLIPCLRKVHPSIELSSETVFVSEQDSNLGAHWKMELKIHTDSLIATILDIAFTISSRQHVALFHCFVGEVRVFVDIRDFDFIDESQSDRNQVNWAISQIGKVREDYLKLKIRHIYGHPTAYVGPAVSRNYQPGDLRTDVVVVNNACVAQEFVFALGGRIYIAEKFLNDYQANVIDIVLPGLTHIDAEDSKSSLIETTRRHLSYFNVADVAFTPTHVAILMEDSSLYLHSHSIYYKGLAYVRETRKFRVGALVKRRWCARTGTPKTHNMILPAYGPRGDIILIQVYPIEGSTNMWITDAPDVCLVKDSSNFEKSRTQILQENANETCIHSDELVVHSDDRGLDITPNATREECSKHFTKPSPTPQNANLDELQSYLLNHGEIFPDIDPHFPKELTNVAIHKIEDNLTHFNLALIFEIDRNGEKLKTVLAQNGFDLTSESIKLHSVEFTAVEKMFITAVVFEAKEFAERTSGGSYAFTMMIASISTVNQPVRLHPEAVKEEEPLETIIPFPGVLLVRGMPYMVKSNSANSAVTAEPYNTKIYPMNTALPAYVIDLGNVYVFSSVESKYARPLSFFPREKIHKILRNIKLGDKGDPKLKNILLKEDRTPIFNPKDYNCPSKSSCPNPSTQLFDILVTEQGTVSVLRRRISNSKISKNEDGQTVYIGSVTTLDSLREIRPFSFDDKLFQLATPDGEIVYGKYTVRGIGYYRNCTEKESQNRHPNQGESCFVQPRSPPKGALPFCVSYDSISVPCTEWKFVNLTKAAGGGNNSIGFCKDDKETSCVHKGADQLIPPDNYPIRELGTAEMLGIPFHSLLNGNLQVVSEEKITDPSNKITGGGLDKSKEDRICPFTNFEVKYLKFDYAEIGFSTRISAKISYLGKNVPSEAELIIEFENYPGIQVVIESGVVKDHDETTLTKTVDIIMTLPDLALQSMKETNIRTDFRDTKNLARETSEVFSITIRPSIINLRCKKQDFYTTVQYNIGCSPFNEMRLIAPASPLVKKHIKSEFEPIEEFDWRREGDYITVPRDHVWQTQRREVLNCNETAPRCKIPFAYLYEDHIYDLSWRDPFVPQFEQILSGRVRRVTGNVAIYDLLGYNTVMNVTQLDAACDNNASIAADSSGKKFVHWYKRILESTKSIGKRASEREDIYQYYTNCYDTKNLPRASALELSSEYFRLTNRSNFNRLRFDYIKPAPEGTKNRNQILIFRAVVINTIFNRFTYCKLMDTFFLVRITGSPAPRQGLQILDAAIVLIILVSFFAVLYFIFYKFCTWKLDIPAIPGTDQEDVEVDIMGNPWKTVFGRVESDHMMKRLAVKVHAVAKWRQKALQRVVKKYQDQPDQKPSWVKARLHEDSPETVNTDQKPENKDQTEAENGKDRQ